MMEMESKNIEEGVAAETATTLAAKQIGTSSMRDQAADVPPSTEENGPSEEKIDNDATQQTAGYDVTPQQEYYDTNQYENYYYEPADGNYYYYSMQGPMVSEEQPHHTGGAPLTPENLVCLYEFDDWEPRSYGWFADIVIDVFMSAGFRIYLFSLLYSFGALLFALSLNWTFQILFRMYAPQPGDQSNMSGVLSYYVIFVYLSFTLVMAFCVWMDMLRGLWHVKRDDTIFWGMSHHSGQKPPFIVYLVLILATAVLPLFWGIIEAATNGESVVFVAQTHAFLSVIITGFIVAICYIWFSFQALRRKRLVFRKRAERDDFLLWEKASKHHTSRPIKRRWHHASTVLEECGLDGKTIRWNAVLFTISAVPLFALYASQALRTYIGSPDAKWGALSSAFLSLIYILAWMTLFRTRAHWAVYASLLLLVAFLMLGVIDGAISGSKEAVFLIIALFVTSHGMLARKRPHTLTRKEQCALFQIDPNPAIHHDTSRRRYDTHLWCCRDVVLSCLKCFDVKKFFGYPHPEILRAEGRYGLNNVTVVADQKVMLSWWLIVTFALALVIGLGNMMVYHYVDGIATRVNAPIIGQTPNLSICGLTYNENGSAPLGVYDLSLLCALSYTTAKEGETDFTKWFSHLRNFVRQHPHHLPPNFNYATDGVTIPFSDYVDLASDYHFVILNANNRGLSFMRSVDEWGTSIFIQISGLLSPLIHVWPERNRASFIYGASFLQRWFSRSDVLNIVSAYINGLIASGKRERILLVGDGFNGGYVKILSSMYGIPCIALNSPGTGYKLSKQISGVEVSLIGSLLSYVDSHEGPVESHYLQCNARYSSGRCSRIESIIEAIGTTCGDRYGRRLK